MGSAVYKDFNELTSSKFSNKLKKQVPGTTDSLPIIIPSIQQVGKSVTEKALESMMIESKIEDAMSAETTFTKKKTLEGKEEKEDQSHSVSIIQDL